MPLEQEVKYTMQQSFDHVYMRSLLLLHYYHQNLRSNKSFPSAIRC